MGVVIHVESPSVVVSLRGERGLWSPQCCIDAVDADVVATESGHQNNKII